MADKIPYEIITHILEYVPNIDIRRHFGIYRKINSINTSYLKYICWYDSEVIHDECVHYRLYNEHNLASRASELLANDIISMCYENLSIGFYYRWSIYRLKRKQQQKTIENKNYYHKGSHNDYYWDYLEYEYTRT